MKKILGILVLITILASSCKSTSKISSTEYGTRTVIDEPVEIFTAIEKSNFLINNITANFTAVVSIDGERNSFNGQLRMLKDSVIWMNVSKFGMEAIRMLMTKDSIFVLNRLDHSVMRLDYRFLTEFVGDFVNFQKLQNLFLGNNFINTSGNYNLSNDGSNYMLYNEGLDGLKVNMLVDMHKNKITVLKIDDVAGRQLNLSYLNYKEVNNAYLPGDIVLNALVPAEFSLKLTYGKIVVDDAEISFPFTIPSNYK